jgi:hypothetical protein
MLEWARKRENGGAVLPKSPHRFSGNEPFGSRSEPGIQKTREIHWPIPGEIPEGRAGAPPKRPPSRPAKADQRPVLEPGVTPLPNRRDRRTCCESLFLWVSEGKRRGHGSDLEGFPSLLGFLNECLVSGVAAKFR